MKSQISLLFSLIMLLLNLNCSKEPQEHSIITNDDPVYKNDDFISFRLAYQIEIGSLDHDYQLLNASWFDVDKSGNLYILDSYDSNIHVFDSQGEHLRTFGRSGQGPEELQSPRCFSIREENIYIIEKLRGVKVLTLAGEYVNYVLPSTQLLTSFKALPVCIIGQTFTAKFSKPSNGEPDIREWSFIRFSDDFSEEHEITKITKHFNFFNNVSKSQVNAIDSEGNLYLPSSDDKYVIHKYDSNGKLVMSFSRDYKRRSYSRDLINWAKRFWNDKIEIPQYPPIVRCIYLDSKDQVWVLIGECFLDSGSEILVNSVVDIFNKNGKFLATFNSELFSEITIIKNGRFYSGPKALGDNLVKVYDIIYNQDL